MHTPVSALLAAALAAQEPPRYGAFHLEIPCVIEVSSLAFGAGDELHTLEPLVSRVRVFDARANERMRFGQRGTGPAQMLEPRGLALDAGGGIWIADTGNDRVQVFDAEGQHVRSLGGRGPRPGELREPHGLALDADRVAVADTGNRRVQVWKRDGSFLAATGPDTGLLRPVAVAFAPDGGLYVADADAHRVVRLARDLSVRDAFGGYGPHPGLFVSPSGLCFEHGRLYVADRDNHRISVHEPDGRPLYRFGVHSLRPREGSGRIHYPEAVAVASSGRFLALAEGFEDRVQLFGPENDMSLVAERQQEPDTSAHFGSFIDAGGPHLALAEPTGGALVLYDAQGEEPVPITRFGAYGTGFGRFVRPEGIALSPEGMTACVADAALRRISWVRLERPPDAELAFDPALGRFVGSLDLAALPAGRHDAPWPVEPGALVALPDHGLLVLDTANARVLVLDRDRRIARTIAGRGEGDARLLRPTAIALAHDLGGVHVVDAGECRIKTFALDGRPMGAFGEHGTGPTQLVRPFGIAAGRDGSLYVSDEGAHRVRRFGPGGRLRGGWGGPGIGAVQFHKPRGIAVASRGPGEEQVLVLDWGNHRVQVLTSEGAFVGAFGARLFVRAALGRSR